MKRQSQHQRDRCRKMQNEEEKKNLHLSEAIFSWAAPSLSLWPGPGQGCAVRMTGNMKSRVQILENAAMKVSEGVSQSCSYSTPFGFFFATLLCEAITAMRNLIWCSKVEPAIRPFMMNNFAAVRVTRCRAAARRQHEC